MKESAIRYLMTDMLLFALRHLLMLPKFAMVSSLLSIHRNEYTRGHYWLLYRIPTVSLWFKHGITGNSWFRSKLLGWTDRRSSFWFIILSQYLCTLICTHLSPKELEWDNPSYCQVLNWQNILRTSHDASRYQTKPSVTDNVRDSVHQSTVVYQYDETTNTIYRRANGCVVKFRFGPEKEVIAAILIPLI